MEEVKGRGPGGPREALGQGPAHCRTHGAYEEGQSVGPGARSRAEEDCDLGLLMAGKGYSSPWEYGV